LRTQPLSADEAVERITFGRSMGEGPFIETFRLLALHLEQMLRRTPSKSILIMSTQPGDGRTTTATALARAMCESQKPVLLIDADPFGTRSGSASALTNGDGLARSQHNGHSLLHRYRPRPELPAAAFINDVAEAISAAGPLDMTAIIDTPPCLNSSIAFGLAPKVGGVLYVARPGTRRRPPHAEIRAQLDLLGATVFGVVVNEA